MNANTKTMNLKTNFLWQVCGLCFGMLFLQVDVMAVSNIFPGVENFKDAVLSLMAVVVVLGLIIILIASKINGGGQINWGGILGGLFAAVLIAGIAASAENFFKGLGINLQAIGQTASSVVW